MNSLKLSILLKSHLILFLLISTTSIQSQNNAMTFDGMDDYLTTGAIGVELKEKTLEGWVKLNTLTQFAGGLIGHEVVPHTHFDAITYNETFQGWGFSSEFFARTDTWSGISETSTSEWVHMAATFADNDYKLYRNGVLILHEVDYPAITYPVNANLIIGQRHTLAGGNDLAAEIDEVRVWSHVRTQDDIISTMNCSCAEMGILPPYGLVACYTFDNFGGDPVADNSGNGLDATIHGDVSYLASAAPITSCSPYMVPTLGEWGLILLSLLVLTFGTLYLHSQPEPNSKESTFSFWNWKTYPFDKQLFTNFIFGIAISVATTFLMAIYFFNYQPTSADIPGTLVCLPIAAYLGQLLMGHKQIKQTSVS